MGRSLAGLAGSVLLSTSETGVSEESGTMGPERFTETVSSLEKISAERRRALTANVDGKTPAELNRLIPETEAIELVDGASVGVARDVLRIIAWNMERGRHWREAAKLIREHPTLQEPDVILLSEMDLGMARSGNERTARELAAALGMNYAYGVEFLELSKGERQEREAYPGGNEWGYHGNAILSVFPLTNLRMVRFPGIEKWYGSYQNRLGGRMALFAEIKVGGKSVGLVSTHLESGLGDGGTRETQIKMLLEELERQGSDCPVILGGDLNALPSSSVVRELVEAGFPIEQSNDLSGGTVQRVKDGRVVLLGLPIDYIAVRGLDVVQDDTSPSRVMAAYPPGETGRSLGDHAAVTVKVRVGP